MYIDARTLDDGSLIEGDICIVGSGAAGISMALDWQASGYDVILLEGGGFNVEAAIQDLYAGESVGQRYYPLQSARLHFFGGTTGHWAGWTSPFDEQDFQERDWIPHSGWPFGLDELKSYYLRAGRLVELDRETFELDAYLGRDPEVVKIPFDDTIIRSKMWQFSSPPTRFGAVYRDEIVDSDTIRLYTYANVCNIETNENVSAVDQLEVRTLEGKRHYVKARQYVLACGAMQNARVLLASNQQNKVGLGNENDLVGRFFMEHLEVQSARLIMPSPEPLKLYTIDLFQTKFAAELALTASAQRTYRVLNGTTSMGPVPTGENPFGIEHYPEDAAETIQIIESLEKMASAGQLGKIDHAQLKQYTMQVRLEQAPNPDSRVMLSEEKDALGVPRLKLDWQLTELDKRSIRQLYETLGQEVGRLGLGRVQMQSWLVDEELTWPTHLGGGWHHMGTARMHKDPSKGVVDENCKVHGIDNLYVAGSATFPTAGAANPTLTIIAMSLRLSDHLKSKMN